METPKVKFCGITNRADADAAVGLGAWALGMILWPHSPRACAPADAAQISAAHRRHAQIAGVFVNPTLDEVVRAADELSLTMLQLHGDEGPAFCAEAARRTGCRVIKAARVRSRADIQALAPFHTDYHLLDSYVPGMPGGSGETFAWELARAHFSSRARHRGSVPLILSGGLTADNVGAAIAMVEPYAVDVASGTESAPGVKDHRALEAFAAAVAATGESGEPDVAGAPSEVAGTPEVAGSPEVAGTPEVAGSPEVAGTPEERVA